MTIWTNERLARILGSDAAPDTPVVGISTDTRSIESGSLFVALEGERFDAHQFLAEARARGAAAAVVRRGTLKLDGLPFYEVDDTLQALGLLAKSRRAQIDGPVIGVTGTNGKTSTKEMLARALGTRWSVHATKENLNNLVGVPLTILSAPDGCEALVVEAGSNAIGEIARLREVIDPSIAVVTNVVAGHLEGFGSVEVALGEKLALLDRVPVGVVGLAPPELAERARDLAVRTITAGLSASADVRPTSHAIDEEGRAELQFASQTVRLPLIGRHQAENAMLALAVAQELKLVVADVAAALANVTVPQGRCEIIRSGGFLLVNDSYNANPASLVALLDTARALRTNRRLVVVLGTMLELGSESPRLHDEMARAVLAEKPDLVAALGEFIPAFEKHGDELGENLMCGGDPESLGKLLAARLSGGELVLLKASRGVQLERALPHLLPNSEVTCSTTC